VQLPGINLNGSTASSLLEDYTTTLTTLRAAREAVGTSGPNGRDYQTSPHGAFETARAEHTVRLAALDVLIGEYEAFAEHCLATIDRAAERTAARAGGR